MQATITSIKDWMDSIHLKCNIDKTEFIIFGSKQQLRKLDEPSLDASGDLIPKSEVVRYLGGYLDASLTFETHQNQSQDSNGKLHQDQVNLGLLINKCLHPTHPNIMCITHRLWKCNTIQIHIQGHQQVSITSKHVHKIIGKKTQILKFKGISLQITLAVKE